ncbi:MAG TPA: hypothetical protein VNO30_21325 [Kofleriaceae bacterium]|nr:hypothetical protein [Kofleriaceae bacterium]
MRAPGAARRQQQQRRRRIALAAAGVGALVLGGALALGLPPAGCGGEPKPPPAPVAVPTGERAAADPSQGVGADVDAPAIAFGGGVLAEITHDQAAARAAYERVLAAPDAPPAIAAGAALYLAWFEHRAGNNRHALDLGARAAGLAPGHAAITDGVAQLRDAIVAAAGADDIRGPRLGTPLPGVPPRVAEEFAAAERAFAAVTKLRVRPNIEAVFATIRYKEDATAGVVAKYRAVAEHGGIAEIAGHYRAGSLYHDLAIALQFELPPELERQSTVDLRHILRTRAVFYLKKAVAEYVACQGGSQAPDSELWRLAAETDLRRARDVLGGSGK